MVTEDVEATPACVNEDIYIRVRVTSIKTGFASNPVVNHLVRVLINSNSE